MKPLYYFILLLIPSSLFSQLNSYSAVQNGYAALNSFYNIVGSEPIVFNNGRQVEGTPFYSDTWMKGIITMRDGNSYKGHGIRLDLLENKVHFLGEDGKPRVCNTPVDRIILLDSSKDQMYSFIYSSALPRQPDFKEIGWLEIMTQGAAASLLKYQKKEKEEIFNYSGPGTDRIKTQRRYYVLASNHIYKVNSIRDIQDVFKSHSPEVDEYVKKEKPSWKNDADIIALIAYYNSLPAKQ